MSAEIESNKPSTPELTTVASDASEDRARDAKLRQRRIRWQWNQPLLWWTVAVCLVMLVLCAASYRYHSGTAADSFLALADAAAEEGDYPGQTKWLARYSMLRPDDQEAIINVALAADNAASNAGFGERYSAIDNARRQLGDSIARLDPEQHAQAVAELRARFIERLLQQGGYWLKEAERQVILANADPDDPSAARWLALAIMGQVNASTYETRNPEAIGKEAGYWQWLANQLPGEILLLALNRNADDLELMAMLLDASQSRPEAFDPVDGSTRDPELLRKVEQRVEESVAKLQADPSGRAKLTLYGYYLGRGLQDEASNVVLGIAEDVSSRLSDARDEQASSGATKDGSDRLPSYYWDYNLLYAAARAASSTDSEQALRWYEQLMAIDLKAISSDLTESVFESAGALHYQSGDQEKALATWEKGLTRVPNSVALLRSIAGYRVEEGQLEEAKKALAQLRSAIELTVLRISTLTEEQLPDDRRAAATRRIELDQWRLEAMEADIAFREGKKGEAISQLTTLMNSNADIDAEYRIEIASRLASMHATDGAWDQSAAALERALTYAPDDADLRARTADAWQRAGNRLQTIEQWQLASSSDSLQIQIATIQARLDYQLRLAPDQRDFSSTRASLDRIRNKLPARGSGTSGSENQAFDSYWALVEMLQASLPPIGMDSEAYFKSSQFADSVSRISADYPTDAAIQAYAAERLAAAGRSGESADALRRLEAIAGPGSTPLELTKARIEVIDGQLIKASQRLVTQANHDPERRNQLLLLATRYAASGGDIELAYRTMTRIPDEDRNLAVLFELAKLSSRLPPDSTLLADGDDHYTPQTLSQHWEDELRKAEGDDEAGTYWKFLKATRLLAELRNSPNRILASDSRAQEIRTLTSEILNLRPRWGEAISLGGYSLAIEANSKPANDKSGDLLRMNAIEELRRGIAAGDQQLRTRLLIIELLGEIPGREAEAERELQLAAYAVDSEIDKYSTIRINLATRQGDFARSLQIAESEAIRRPEDFRAHEVLARTAIFAAKKTTDVANRSALLEKASKALEKAFELADQDQSSLYSAKLGLLAAQEDLDGIPAQVDKITASSLTPYNKAMLKARAFEVLGDDANALAMLKEAHKHQPSAQGLLAQAVINRRLDRKADAIEALREARKLDPNSEDLRFSLATLLIENGGDQINWDELSDLLSASKGASSKNRVQHAFILFKKGNASQKRQAVTILRELYRERNELSDDAGRLLAVMLREQLTSENAGSENVRNQLIGEVRSIYATLIDGNSPSVLDLYQFANFLLELDQKQDYAQIEQIRDDLNRIQNGVLHGLELGVRHAQRTLAKEQLSGVVQAWEAQVRSMGFLSDDDIAVAAGVALLKLGIPDIGLKYLEQAYRINPDKLAQYVVSLVGANQVDTALDVCIKHYQEHGDAKSAILLTETLLKRGDRTLSPEHKELLQQALRDFPDNLPLMEGLATLRLQQQSPEDAIALYTRILKMDPIRVRTLNNLAMAFAETPGRAAEGVEPIDRAIKVAGEVPELLDTKGVVLMKADRLDEACAVFQQAFSETSEPRFQFHIVMTLLAQNKLDEAKQAWKSLDLDRLDPSGLTANEQIELENMKKEFGSK